MSTVELKALPMIHEEFSEFSVYRILTSN